MINFRRVLIALVCLSFVCMNAQSAQNKAYRNFWQPTFHKARLAYCTLDGKSCGKAVANRYCQMLGYDLASENIIAYNLGLTHYLSTNAVCKGWRCNGFMTIGCVTSLTHQPPKAYAYSKKRFAKPRFNQFRIDWCYARNKGCGSRAANSFCSRLGYMKAVSFIKETKIAATKTIGSQELCFGNACSGFETIVCSR